MNKNITKNCNNQNLKANYLDYDNKGWSNISGYGNMVNTKLTTNNDRNVQTIISPWDRLQPLTPPYYIENTQYSWSPPLTTYNQRQLYESCAICPSFQLKCNNQK